MLGDILEVDILVEVLVAELRAEDRVPTALVGDLRLDLDGHPSEERRVEVARSVRRAEDDYWRVTLTILELSGILLVFSGRRESVPLGEEDTLHRGDHLLRAGVRATFAEESFNLVDEDNRRSEFPSEFK